MCFFNRSWKSWTQIFQNWSYLCTYIEIKFQKSTKRPFFLTILGTKKSNLKKSLAGGTGNWLVWTHFWIPYDIWVLKMGVCTQEATLNVFRPSGRSDFVLKVWIIRVQGLHNKAIQGVKKRVVITAILKSWWKHYKSRFTISNGCGV